MGWKSCLTIVFFTKLNIKKVHCSPVSLLSFWIKSWTLINLILFFATLIRFFSVSTLRKEKVEKWRPYHENVNTVSCLAYQVYWTCCIVLKCLFIFTAKRNREKKCDVAKFIGEFLFHFFFFCVGEEFESKWNVIMNSKE